MKKRAFTLIELLVVISIIAILMAIMMPALKRVKEQATGVVCRSHFKDIGVMLNLYMQDNEGCMVSNRYHASGTASGTGRWTTRLGQYYNANDKDVVGHGRYNTEIFHCPIEWRKREKTGTVGYAVNGGFYYEINGLISNGGDNDNVIQSKFEKSLTWKNASTLPLFHDNNSDVPEFMFSTRKLMYPSQNLAKYGWNLGSPRNPNIDTFGPAANHGRGINYLFGDNHVDMTLWPYENTMSNPEPQEYYYKYWHPLHDLSIKSHEDAKPL
ncbi:MAG: type II secretion system protein [Sedimentisphaeraceae bacterium JB056]